MRFSRSSTMWADWDASSDRLVENLTRVADAALAAAERRAPVSIATMRQWHDEMMAGLEIPDPGWAGCFRGEGAAHDIGVMIGTHRGVAADRVTAELAAFEQRPVQVVAVLDETIGSGGADTEDEIGAVIGLCAWTHGEWVRIHPFVNGSGRTARLGVNFLVSRYGLPRFATLRPRPRGPCGAAAASAMTGDWKAMIPVFVDMLDAASSP